MNYESDYKQGTEEQRPDMNPWGFKPNPQAQPPPDFGRVIQMFMDFIDGLLMPGEKEVVEPEPEIDQEKIDAFNKEREDRKSRPFVASPSWSKNKGDYPLR